MKSILASLVLCLLSSVSLRAQQLIGNGSFTAGLGGWTTSGGTTSGGWQSIPYDVSGVLSNAAVASVSMIDPSAQISVSMGAPNGWYECRFDASVVPYGFPTQNAVLSVNFGVTQLNIEVGPQGWRDHVVVAAALFTPPPFIALNCTFDLGVTLPINGGYGVAIDNVSVRPLAFPAMTKWSHRYGGFPSTLRVFGEPNAMGVLLVDDALAAPVSIPGFSGLMHLQAFDIFAIRSFDIFGSMVVPTIVPATLAGVPLYWQVAQLGSSPALSHPVFQPFWL